MALPLAAHVPPSPTTPLEAAPSVPQPITPPDSLVAASVRGNMEIPQIYVGAAIRMGVLVVRMLRDGTMSYDEFLSHRLRVSLTQAERMGEAATAAHIKYGIASRFDPARPEGTTKEEREAGQPPFINIHDFRGNYATSTDNVSAVLRGYARRVIDLPKPRDNGNREASARFHAGHSHVTELLGDSKHRSKLDALVALWERAEAVLKTPEALEEASRYRTDLGEQHKDRPRHLYLRAQEEYRMHRMLRAHMGTRQVRGAIRRQTGYAVSKRTVDDFIHTMSYHYGQKLAISAGFEPERTGFLSRIIGR